MPDLQSYMPHGMCYLWEPELLGMHVVSDALIALAYFGIPVALVRLVRRRGDLPFHWVFLLFALFIVACGLTHVVNIWTVWNPDYWVSGSVKAVTAAASIATLVALVPTLPRALALRGPSELERLNRELARSEAELRATIDRLEAQRLVEGRFEESFERTPIGLALVALDGTFMRVNAALQDILGYEEDELLSLTFQDITHPDDLEAGLAEVQRLSRGEIESFRMEKRYHHKRGHDVPIMLTASAVRDADGRPLHYIAHLQDITEHKRQVSELERSNRELQQFAYVASHDLQEPLRMVASFTELLRRRYEGQIDERADQYIAFASEGAQRMQALLQGLLEFSRVATHDRDPTRVETGEVVEEVLQNLAIRIRETGATVDVGELPAVRADRAQLGQVFQNLVANALKFAGPDPPRVEIRGERRGADCVFTVSDNGIGIDPRYGERIFQIFQRLHARDAYEGLGMGLSICKRIVEMHGGDIRLESTLGEGASFIVRLPAA